MTVTKLLANPWIFPLFALPGIAAFGWPFVAVLLPTPHFVLVSIAVIVASVVVIGLLLAIFWTVGDSKTLALIGVLAALAAAARMLSVGAGGIEFVFVVVIIAGRALGPRGGFAVGALAIAVSSMIWGGFGPWTPFQMLAIGLVGSGAGIILPSRVRPGAGLEIALLAIYGAVASYTFGALMNLWFWPLALGSGTSLSLVGGDSFSANLGRFVVYCLTTSTLTWDTVRAITTVVSLVLIGRASLTALRRVSGSTRLDREVLGLRVMEHERVG